MKQSVLLFVLCLCMLGMSGCKKDKDASDSEAGPSGSSFSDVIDKTAGDVDESISDLSEKAESAIHDAQNKVSGEIEKAAENMVAHMESLGMTLRSIKDKKTAETVSGKISDLIGKIQAALSVLGQTDEESQMEALFPYQEKMESYAATIQQEFQRLAMMPDVMPVLADAFKNLSDLPGFNAETE